MNNQLDPQVVNLAKAIRQTESGGNFSAQGKSGEMGGYQFTPDTWNASAPQYGITSSLKDATPEEQNAVAYNRIKSWKDQGKDVTQIASMWNAGEGEPDAYTGKFGTTTKTHNAGDPSVGINSFGAKYDVPAYAKSVSNAYLSLKNGGQVSVDPNNPSSVASPQFPLKSSTQDQNESTAQTSTQNSGLLGQLTDKASDAGGAVDDLYNNKINPLTGGLRIVGDIAGGINDIAGSAFQNTIGRIPVVKSILSAIGGKISDVVNSPTGKSIASSYQKFSTTHPELASDLNAGYNIVSVLPLLTGVGGALEGTASALTKSAIEKGISTSLEQAGVEGADGVAQTLAEEGAATPKIIKGVKGNTLDFTEPKQILSKSLAQSKEDLASLNDTSAPLKKGTNPEQYSQQVTDAENRVKQLQDAIKAINKIDGATIKKGVIQKAGSLAKKGAILGAKTTLHAAELGGVATAIPKVYDFVKSHL